MANLKQRLHRKNASGSYDVIYLETSAAIVKRADGITSVEDSLIAIESALSSVSGSKRFYGTIGTTWSEDANTGVKIQEVSIPGILETMDLGNLDVIMTHERTSDGYALFVEENNQFLNLITNGDAETYGTDETNGGVRFYIYGDAPTVSIPFGLVVS